MRVLIVDDHSLFRDGLVSLLQAAEYEVIGQVGDGEAAITETLRLQPDLVLMDIRMPKMNGLEALRRIKAQNPEITIVMLTVSEDERDLVEAIKAGASGYLLKNSSAEEFLASLQGLKHGELALRRSSAAQVIQYLIDSTGQPADPIDNLTQREVETLLLVVEGLSNKAIALRLSVSENTVKYHMKNILQKLGVQNRTEAVTYAIRAGLLTQNTTG